jgi:hypothetical protein
MAAAYALVGAVTVMSFLNEHPEVRTALREEALLAGARLRLPSWRGPSLDWDALTRDVAAANHALASLATDEGRYVVGVAHRGRARAFLRALSFSPAVARLLGDVTLDIEWRARPRDHRDDEEEEVLSAVRHCDLLQAHAFLFPALQQLARDAATPAAAQEPASERGSDTAECCICFAAPVDCISPCAHGFCSDCYHRWRRQDAGCALCRAPLPASERWGLGSYMLIDKPEMPDGDGAGVTRDRVLAWIRALPRASEPER